MLADLVVQNGRCGSETSSGVEGHFDQSIVVPRPMHRDMRRIERQGEDSIAVNVALLFVSLRLDPNSRVDVRGAEQLQSIDTGSNHNARAHQSHEGATADPWGHILKSEPSLAAVRIAGRSDPGSPAYWLSSFCTSAWLSLS